MQEQCNNCGYLLTNNLVCTKCGCGKAIFRNTFPKLEDWSVVCLDENPYLAPELKTVKLQGTIFDDNRGFLDGCLVLTSKLVRLNVETKTAQTLNTTYILGNIDPEYDKWLKDNGMEIKSFGIESEV